MKTKHGIITSAKMQNTVTVTVHRYIVHPMYSKRYRVSKKFLADTRGFDDLAIGDEVVIAECKPISKRKHFRLTEVKKRAPRVGELREEESVAAASGSKNNEEEKKASDASPSAS